MRMFRIGVPVNMEIEEKLRVFICHNGQIVHL